MLGDIGGDKEYAGLWSRSVQRVNDQALVGRMLERQWGFLVLRYRDQIGLRVGERVQLRRAAGKGQRKRE